MTQPEKIEPDGYCAWHPENGWQTLTLAGDVDTSLMLLVDNEASGEDFDGDEPGIQMDNAIKLGWQICPVCLIPPDELERLRAVEEWAKKTYESLIEMGQAQRMLGRDILAATIDVITDDFNKLLEGGGK